MNEKVGDKKKVTYVYIIFKINFNIEGEPKHAGERKKI